MAERFTGLTAVRGLSVVELNLSADAPLLVAVPPVALVDFDNVGRHHTAIGAWQR